MFANRIIAVMFLVFCFMTPAFAWRYPLAVKSPRTFAGSKSVAKTVTQLISASYPSQTPSEADITQLMANVAKDGPSLAAAMSAASSGGPQSYESAVLQAVLDATDLSCPIEGDSVNDVNERKNKKKHKNKTKKTTKSSSTANNKQTGGRIDCAAQHEQCLASCSTHEHGGFFGRFTQSAAPGACDLVCTAVHNGCHSCSDKRALHAAANTGGVTSSMIANVRISSPEDVEDMFNTIVRVTVTLWTFVENMTSLVWTFVDSVIKQLWVCANRLFSSVTFWQVAALAGWAQTLFLHRGWVASIANTRLLNHVRNDRDTCAAECKRQSSRKVVMLVPLKAAAREAERWRREKEAKRAIITASIKERAERQRLAREAEAAEREAEAAERERVAMEHEDRNRVDDRDPAGQIANTAVSIGCNTDNNNLANIVGGFVADRVQGVLAPLLFLTGGG